LRRQWLRANRRAKGYQHCAERSGESCPTMHIRRLQQKRGVAKPPRGFHFSGEQGRPLARSEQIWNIPIP
jgi:hypothetical protein